jgi:hypothetical protein
MFAELSDCRIGAKVWGNAAVGPFPAPVQPECEEFES